MPYLLSIHAADVAAAYIFNIFYIDRNTTIAIAYPAVSAFNRFEPLFACHCPVSACLCHSLENNRRQQIRRKYIRWYVLMQNKHISHIPFYPIPHYICRIDIPRALSYGLVGYGSKLHTESNLHDLIRVLGMYVCLSILKYQMRPRKRVTALEC